MERAAKRRDGKRWVKGKAGRPPKATTEGLAHMERVAEARRARLLCAKKAAELFQAAIDNEPYIADEHYRAEAALIQARLNARVLHLEKAMGAALLTLPFENGWDIPTQPMP